MIIRECFLFLARKCILRKICEKKNVDEKGKNTFLGTTIDIGSHNPFELSLYRRNISHLLTFKAHFGNTPNPRCGMALVY